MDINATLLLLIAELKNEIEKQKETIRVLNEELDAPYIKD